MMEREFEGASSGSVYVAKEVCFRDAREWRRLGYNEVEVYIYIDFWWWFLSVDEG